MKRLVRLLLLFATAVMLVFAFGACSEKSGKLTYTLNSDGNSYGVSHDWSGESYYAEEFRFPDTYKGKPVTSIFSFGSDSRSFCVDKVIIPASVKSLDGFRGLWGLKEVFFEEGSQCELICPAAFFGCESLEKINLPKNVTRILSEAFYDCKALKDISIPEGVTEIGESAFYNCGLESVSLPLVTEIENRAFLNCKLTSVTLSENLQTIGESAFSYTTLSSIELPDSLTTIKPYAFSSSLLKAIEIPASVQEISEAAFENCRNLETVTFQKNSQCAEINSWAFKGCSALKNLQLGDGLKSIAKECFSGCVALTDISIPDSVERIEKNAFERCSGLSTVRFGENSKCTYFGENAFWKCEALENLYIENIRAWCLSEFVGEYATPLYYADKLYFNGKTTDLVIPADITAINNSIFINLVEVERIIFEDGSKCKSIGKSAFRGCTALRSVSFGSSGALENIGSYAFADCPNLSSFTMPATVKSVGEYAFYNCEGLREVATENIAAWCAIEFGNEKANPVHYSESLLQNGKPLAAVIIPSGLERIGAYTFENCLTLTEITLPASIKRIGAGAFGGCTKLEKIHLTSLAAWCTMQFEDWTASPMGFRANLYMNGSLLTDITIPDEVKTLGERAFENCYAIQTVHFNKVTSIGAEAFSGCEALTKVYIPSTVTKIGENAFEYCENLTIYAQALIQPIGWHNNWNPLNRPVHWGKASMN